MHTYINSNTSSSSISKRPEVQTYLHITMETQKLWGDKRERAIKELVKGRGIATQLQNLLLLDHNSSELEHGFVSAEELVAKISDSFTQTLSLLDLTSSHHLSNQDTGDSTNTSPVKNRRGRYKRRKTSDSWMTVSSTLEDGYSWRKYGQKEILNSKYPRCYFRCTHKHDQGCQALKQVQQSEEDGSKMFNVTYFGRHKCNRAATIVMPVQTISDSDSVFKSGNELFNDYMLDSSISWQENDSNEQPMLFSLEMGFDDHEYSLESSIGHAYASTNSYGLDTKRSLIRCVSFDNDFQFDENDFFGIHIPSL